MLAAGGKMSDWLTLVPDIDSDNSIGPRRVTVGYRRTKGRDVEIYLKP